MQAALIAAACALLAVVLLPSGADYPAAEFRTWLFETHGFTTWNDQWYGGHSTPAYSLLFPPLGALLGVQFAAVVFSVAAAGLFAALAVGHFGPQTRIGVYWFALATATNVIVGRLPFSLGVVLALASLLAWQRGRRQLALVLAVLCPLGSPVAAIFLAVAGAAHALGSTPHGRSQRLRPFGVVLALAALLPALVLVSFFPEGGNQPFPFTAFLPVILFALVALLIVPREEETLRVAIVIYLAIALLSFLIPTPLGGNVVRLGAIIGGPVLACVFFARDNYRSRLRALAATPALFLLVALPLLWWQWSSVVEAVTRASRDASLQAAYYKPLLAQLGRDHSQMRIEIPFTQNHWEAFHVAKHYRLARGWERQLDIKRNALFYSGPLSAERYRRWLNQVDVRYVALPDAPLDYSAVREGALIKRGLPYLDEIWHSKHWRLYTVRSD